MKTRRSTVEFAPEMFRDGFDVLLERYAVGTLPSSVSGPMGKHLLHCTHCQERLKILELYSQAMNVAMTTAESNIRREATRVAKEPHRATGGGNTGQVRSVA